MPADIVENTRSLQNPEDSHRLQNTPRMVPFPKPDEPIQYLMSYFFKILLFIKYIFVFTCKISSNRQS